MHVDTIKKKITETHTDSGGIICTFIKFRGPVTGPSAATPMRNKTSETYLCELYRIATKSSAYMKFLKKHGVTFSRLKSASDFSKLPITTKTNYLQKYPLFELGANKKLPPFAYASSGSSGTPTFWFVDESDEIEGGKIHERIVRKIFGISKKERTLVVVCFSMGIWVAGNFTFQSFRWVSRQGYNITTITPGIDTSDILHIFKELAPNFDNLIVVGYPPFLMDIMARSRKEKIHFDRQKIFFLSAGDMFTEKWRDSFLSLVPTKRQLPPHTLISIYGSADANVMGHETPMSIFLRREAQKNKKLCTELFGDVKKTPELVQYDPALIYFEDVDGELILSKHSAVPLVRYNIHDTGAPIHKQIIDRMIRKYDLAGKIKRSGIKDLGLPYLYLTGRTDVAVTLYSLNILPDHIQSGIEDKQIQHLLSGSYLAFTKLDRGKHERLVIHLELASGVSDGRQHTQPAKETITRHLLQSNIEYSKLHSVMGAKAEPIVRLFPYGTNHNLANIPRAIHRAGGRKPKIITK